MANNFMKGTCLALILARGGSKGLPGKNIKEFCGKPLIQWSIEHALGSKYVDHVAVSTDSENIASISLAAGADIPFIRPAYLSADTSSSIDALVHAIDFYESIGKYYEYILLLEPTSPLREVSDIDQCIEYSYSNDLEAVVSLTEAFSNHPRFMFKLGRTNSLSPYIESNILDANNLRRQDLDKCYALDGTLYLSKITSLRKNKGFYHQRTHGIVLPKWKSIEIDDYDDFVMAEALMRARQNLD